MATAGEKAGAVLRSAIRVYLITAGVMFLSGAVGGALLAIAGYRVPNPF
jgi:hypothetical protein